MPGQTLGRYLLFTRETRRSGRITPEELGYAADFDVLNDAIGVGNTYLEPKFGWFRVIDTQTGTVVADETSEPSVAAPTYFAPSYWAKSYFGALGGV